MSHIDPGGNQKQDIVLRISPQDAARVLPQFVKGGRLDSVGVVRHLEGLLGLTSPKIQRKEAARWYRKAAMLGLPEGQYNYGESYVTGQGVEENRI
jgi:TPR repeat protein